MIGDLAAGKLTVIDRSEASRTRRSGVVAGRAWLAYSFWTSARHSAIKLHDVARNRSTLVTHPEFRDYCPAFDPEGRYPYFLSLRTFDPVYDSVQFELSFPRGARPYLIALQAGGRPPFDPPPQGARGRETPSRGDQEGGRTRRCDAAGRARRHCRRIAPFPVKENRYGQIAGVAQGKVIWTVLPIAGAHGRGGHKESPGRLEVFDFEACERKR